MPVIIAETILSGLFDKFPRLRFISVEAGAGWVPYFLEQMDDRYFRNRTLGEGRARDAAERLLPSQLAADLRARTSTACATATPSASTT